MPLIYKAFQSSIPTKDGKKKFYPRLVKAGSIVTLQTMATVISEKSSVTPGDVHNVVRELMSVMRTHLLNSRSVRLDGLGTFTMVATASGNGVNTASEVTPAQITNLRCRFTPEYTRNAGAGTTRALTSGVEYINLSELAKGYVSTDSSDDENSGGSTGGNASGGGGLEE